MRSKPDDRMFYGGYGVIFISLGVWILLSAMGIIDEMAAFFFWLATIGLTLMAIDSFKAEKPTHRRKEVKYGLFFGFFLVIISIAFLAVIYDYFTPVIAVGLIIILVGVGVFLYAFTKDR
jgi:hypothetical protein